MFFSSGIELPSVFGGALITSSSFQRLICQATNYGNYICTQMAILERKW